MSLCKVKMRTALYLEITPVTHLKSELLGFILESLLLLITNGLLALSLKVKSDLMTSVIRVTSYPDAEISLNHPRHDHREEAKDEGEDGGQEEAPPLPLHQALLIVDERDALVFGKDDVAVTIL